MMVTLLGQQYNVEEKKPTVILDTYIVVTVVVVVVFFTLTDRASTIHTQ